MHISRLCIAVNPKVHIAALLACRQNRERLLPLPIAYPIMADRHSERSPLLAGMDGAQVDQAALADRSRAEERLQLVRRQRMSRHRNLLHISSRKGVRKRGRGLEGTRKGLLELGHLVPGCFVEGVPRADDAYGRNAERKDREEASEEHWEDVP